MGIKQRSVDSSLGLITTDAEETTIEDSIQMQYIPLSKPQIEGVSSMYMQDDDAESDKWGIWHPKLYVLATETWKMAKSDQ